MDVFTSITVNYLPKGTRFGLYPQTPPSRMEFPSVHIGQEQYKHKI